MVSSFFNDLVQTLGDRSRYLLGWSREAVKTGDLPSIGEALLSRRGEASGGRAGPHSARELRGGAARDPSRVPDGPG
jgi:hypothetical protein